MVRRGVALALLLACASLPARAVEIGFTAIDLPDGGNGDLWRLAYTLDVFPYDAAHGFSIGFDPALYRDLSDPPAAGPDWDVIALQPDPLLPDFGLYDALARVALPSVAGPFQIDAIYLGAGAPGPQPFVVYAPDFAPIATGITLPEPAWLSGFALLLAALTGRRAARARRDS